jgi:HAE1 family hydrophobic/amphiphilic exporter-1
MGIVKKNSILLVDYTNQVREKGKDRDEALIEACPARLRPILMTTFATVTGALPSALAFGAGGELLIPMATAIIGGLTLSTLLTLVVVPCFYSVVDEFNAHLKRFLRWSWRGISWIWGGGRPVEHEGASDAGHAH